MRCGRWQFCERIRRPAIYGVQARSSMQDPHMDAERMSDKTFSGYQVGAMHGRFLSTGFMKRHMRNSKSPYFLCIGYKVLHARLATDKRRRADNSFAKRCEICRPEHNHAFCQSNVAALMTAGVQTENSVARQRATLMTGLDLPTIHRAADNGTSCTARKPIAKKGRQPKAYLMPAHNIPTLTRGPPFPFTFALPTGEL